MKRQPYKKESVYDKAHELYKDFRSNIDNASWPMVARVEHIYGIEVILCDKSIDELKQWCREKWSEVSSPTLAQIKKDGKVVWEHWEIKKETIAEFEKRKQKDKWQWVKKKG